MFTDGVTFFFLVSMFPLFEFLVIYSFVFAQHVSCNSSANFRWLKTHSVNTFRDFVFDEPIDP